MSTVVKMEEGALKKGREIVLGGFWIRKHGVTEAEASATTYHLSRQ